MDIFNYRRNMDNNTYYTGLPTMDQTLMSTLNLKLFTIRSYILSTIALVKWFWLNGFLMIW